VFGYKRKIKTSIPMKKVMSIIAVAAITSVFAACGQSAEEKAKQEADAKRMTDSIANAISNSMAAPAETVAPADSNAAATSTTPAAEEHK
jgi:hypothetical protein